MDFLLPDETGLSLIKGFLDLVPVPVEEAPRRLVNVSVSVSGMTVVDPLRTTFDGDTLRNETNVECCGEAIRPLVVALIIAIIAETLIILKRCNIVKVRSKFRLFSAS